MCIFSLLKLYTTPFLPFPQNGRDKATEVDKTNTKKRELRKKAKVLQLYSNGRHTIAYYFVFMHG